jgi:predicted nucleic acid-binding protein
MKIYLDTNVVIQGPACPEHVTIRELAKDKRIDLYFSPTGQHEQRARSIVAVKEPLSDEPKVAAEQVRQRKVLDDAEQNERAWWYPASLNYPHCTFEGLLSSVGLAVLLGDVTGELAQLTELLDRHNLKVNDAMHAMIAHSASMDRLLTWDDKTFIRKASAVPWLKPIVQTPRDFLTDWWARHPTS